MSILIKSMNLPEDGCHHMVCIYGNGVVVTNGGQWIAEELPPHGRCIDADSKTFPTLHRNPSNDYMKGWNACLRSVQQQPTIIPADPEEEEMK